MFRRKARMKEGYGRRFPLCQAFGCNEPTVGRARFAEPKETLDLCYEHFEFAKEVHQITG